MISKLFKKIIARYLRVRGYSDYFSSILANDIFTDLTQGAKIGLKRRWWAYRHGFLGDTVAYYGLTPETYKDYLPDFHYYKLHPLNGVWSRWIDDKLTTRYVLAPFAEYLPECYFHLRGSEILPLMDCPAGLAANATGVFTLLQRQQQLAVKVVDGSGGAGFFKLEWHDGCAFINRQPATMAEFELFVASCTNHTVSEYLISHSYLREIYAHTANTVRVWAIRAPGDSASIEGAFIRFGTKQSGVVDNVAAGGISCGVRVEDGVLFRPCREERTRVIELTVHPDTGTPVAGTVPHWEMVKAKILQICAYVPQLCYLGFDVVITEEGFKILEINSHQSPTVQLHQPFLQSGRCRHFFLQALNARGIKIDQT